MKTIVTRNYIENQLSELNEWIAENPNHELIRMKKDSVVYYAQKLQEMDENNLTHIEIWKKG